MVGRVKGKTSRKLLAENRRLAKQFRGRHLWARGYFAASSGNVTNVTIMQYIATQDLQERAHDGVHYAFVQNEIFFDFHGILWPIQHRIGGKKQENQGETSQNREQIYTTLWMSSDLEQMRNAPGALTADAHEDQNREFRR